VTPSGIEPATFRFVAQKNALSENVNLGSNWPYYFIKAAKNSATFSENFSFQNYTKSVKLSKGKGKGHPKTDYEGPEGEQMYSSALALTPALDGVGGQRQAEAILTPPPPGKTRYPLLGGPQGRSD
jgi:hypothetical protein